MKYSRPLFAIIVGSLLSLIMLGGSSPVWAAESLLDILRQKGTISEQEYRNLKAAQEAEQARIEAQLEKLQPNFDITYKDGFRLTSRDQQFELRVGVQVFNQFSIFPADADADDNFRLRRGRVTFRGKVLRDFT